VRHPDSPRQLPRLSHDQSPQLVILRPQVRVHDEIGSHAPGVAQEKQLRQQIWIHHLHVVDRFPGECAQLPRSGDIGGDERVACEVAQE